MSPAAADCPFSHCLCRWVDYCSPRIPPIAPDGEYISTPAHDRDLPAWSVCAGIVSMAGGHHSLRLHRFCVAYSGRVLGRSCDILDTFGDDCYEAKGISSRIRASTATRHPPPDYSISLFLISREFHHSGSVDIEQSRPVPMRLVLTPDDRPRRFHLPDLPRQIDYFTPICPVSAAGHLWAPYLTESHGPCYLVMLRFDNVTNLWVEVACIDAKRPPASNTSEEYTINPLQGSAVIGDTILLSLYPYHLFFIFQCSDCSFGQVVTSKAQEVYYLPIHGCGVYVDDTIYVLFDGTVYAYKLLFDDQNAYYQMAPPTKVDRIFPFKEEEGSGYLACLGEGLMCALWISLNLRCNYDSKHVLITTFRAKGSFNPQFVPEGLEVLHSTWRMLDLFPSKPSESYYDFIFLQQDRVVNLRNPPPMWLGLPQVPASSNLFEPSNMLTCCRQFLNEPQFSTFAMCERSVIKNDKTLFVICQVASHSTMYKISILDGRLRCHDETLEPHGTLETISSYDDKDMMSLPLPAWHFLCDGSYIYAVSSTENDSVYMGDMHTECIHQIIIRRPIGVVFHLVFLVGHKAVALTNDLQGIYVLDFNTSKWIFQKTCAPPFVKKEVRFSGYVVLDWGTMMVSDADSKFCYMLNIYDHDGVWKVVKPNAQFETSAEVITFHEALPDQPSLWSSLMYGRPFLNGRSFFASGFLYTCSDGGLAAYELIEHGGSHYLGDQIHLQFSWPKSWDEDRMCLLNVDEDTTAGAVMFCVLQDDHICQPGYDKKPVRITTVQVITEQLPSGKLKPRKIGHVDMAMSSVDLNGKVQIRNCFALQNIV